MMKNFEEIKKTLLPQMTRMAEEVKAKLKQGQDDGDVFEELEAKLATAAEYRQSGNSRKY